MNYSYPNELESITINNNGCGSLCQDCADNAVMRFGRMINSKCTSQSFKFKLELARQNKDAVIAFQMIRKDIFCHATFLSVFIAIAFLIWSFSLNSTYIIIFWIALGFVNITYHLIFAYRKRPILMTILFSPFSISFAPLDIIIDILESYKELNKIKNEIQYYDLMT
ncbi:MAG: hypothetical protein DRR08_22340 [Candidatus Parabeggiatoa sp. nov. 2]|nr:MAG: hypothetical protein DRR08_22340 [Gammaproteobacteria bacterium]